MSTTRRTISDQVGSVTYDVQMDATLATVVAESGDTAAILGRMGYRELRSEVVERNRDAAARAHEAYRSMSPERRAALRDPYSDAQDGY